MRMPYCTDKANRKDLSTHLGCAQNCSPATAQMPSSSAQIIVQLNGAPQTHKQHSLTQRPKATDRLTHRPTDRRRLQLQLQLRRRLRHSELQWPLVALAMSSFSCSWVSLCRHRYNAESAIVNMSASTSTQTLPIIIMDNHSSSNKWKRSLQLQLRPVQASATHKDHLTGVGHRQQCGQQIKCHSKRLPSSPASNCLIAGAKRCSAICMHHFSFHLSLHYRFIHRFLTTKSASNQLPQFWRWSE